jgi:uncharacterized protein YrrD
MADPVSWLVIERGWRVLGPDGDELGEVDEVMADAATDIFNGLDVRSGAFGRKRYLPAERITEIVEGAVTVDVTDLDALETRD